ncbi:3-hydroxyacyl-CoA dehydrogenase NAD-binding domain-containing protein [Bradyrhizobium sp. CCGB12]|nr:3-hydroxyacyl-CoA dehydrogenase NAD-binding domain-containing protein [Bradyrhizobium sp. CCGB12]
MRSNYDVSVGRGSIAAAARDQRMALLSGTTHYEDVPTADIIIEAVFEDIALKKRVLASLTKLRNLAPF